MQFSRLRDCERVRPGVVALVSIYVLEFSALIGWLAFYKKSDRALPVFLVSAAGSVFLFALVILAISSFVLVHQFRARSSSKRKEITAAVVLNVWSVILLVATTEVTIRALAVSTPGGPMFANTLLLPRDWKSFAARNRGILAKASTWGSYFVYDRMLGWTVGRSRRGQDGLYLSSVEGIRSPRVGMNFSNGPSRHRIAIVGDSFTFGLEVPYEETWGHQLELALGPGTQVLNFGVDGYGVDQAYLRYQRDVLSWRPDIVILGIINDDVTRTMGVYGFLKFIDSDMPFPKPRFVMKGDTLIPLNLPLPTPESIFTSVSIAKLPFIDYDGSFRLDEWEWHFYHHSYLIRFLLSRFPRWAMPRSNVSDEVVESINGELFRAFVRLAHEQGSTPIIVYFPSRSDFALDGAPQVGLTKAKEVLRVNGISYLDMTACVSQINQAERYVKTHYSPGTNAAIAKCLEGRFVRRWSHEKMLWHRDFADQVYLLSVEDCPADPFAVFGRKHSRSADCRRSNIIKVD